MKRVLIGLGVVLVLVIVLVIIAPNWEKVDVKVEDKDNNANKLAQEQAITPEEKAQVEEKPIINEKAPQETTETKSNTPANIESIIFGYSTSSFSQANVIYYVKGNLVKIVLPKTKDVGMKRYDTIYLDRTSNSGVAYCEAKGYCNDRNKQVSVSFESYDALTPVEWNGKLARKHYVNDDTANGKRTKIYYDNGIKYWIDVYYDLPIKVQDVYSENYYNILSFNLVKDKDLVHHELENY